MLKESCLYERLPGSRVRCGVCQRGCVISEGHAGWCGTRINRGGVLYSVTYGEVSSISVNPIEKKPVYHFLPGSRWLSVGSWGCNFRCPGCQNWHIAHQFPAEGLHQGARPLSPRELVELAVRRRCDGISWTFNEPTLWLEFSLDTAKLAKDSGLYTNYVTNGAMTMQALELLSGHLDVYRVDIKGFSPRTYRRIAHLEQFEGILRVCEAAKGKGMHVEVVTNIIPSVNDSSGELREMALWILRALGEETPWHITRFVPHLEWSHLPLTPVETLEGARRMALEVGLRYVYIGNVPGHPAQNTYCPMCGTLLIARSEMTVRRLRLRGDKCPRCGLRPPGRFQKD